MPRIIVTTDAPRLPRNASVLLDESVHPVHLSSGHAAAQLIERLAWAISDAETAESRLAERPAGPGPSRSGRRRDSRAHALPRLPG